MRAGGVAARTGGQNSLCRHDRGRTHRTRLSQPLAANDARAIAQPQSRQRPRLDIGWTFFNAAGEEVPLICQALTLIGARTSGGKTLTLANIAARIALTRPDAHVLFLTLEEAHESVFYRVLSSYLAQSGRVPGHIGIAAIERAIDTDGASLGAPHDRDGRDIWDAITAGVAELSDRLLIADLIALPEAEKAGQAAALIGAFVDRCGAENAVICLDYIQLLRPDKQGSGTIATLSASWT